MSKVLLVVGLLWGLGSVACSPNSARPPAATDPATTAAGGVAQANKTYSNVLLIVDGDVRLKRANWNDFFPASLGTIVPSGDVLKLNGDANASVLCMDLTLWSVPAGGPQGVNTGCPAPAEPDIVRDGISLGTVRSVPEDIPYILMPRATNIMTTTPLLRWNPVAGAESYEVLVRGKGLEWKQTVDGDTNEIRYPAESPLVAGEVYSLIVTVADGRSSADEGTPNLGFRLLTSGEMAEVERLAARVEDTIRTDEARSLALAYIYASRTDGNRRLITPALDEIETLLAQGIASPALYQFQGELYRTVGLPNEARRAFEAALTLAEETAEIAGQADALAALGQLLSRGNCEERKQAAAFLERASTTYDQLGDSVRASEVEAQVPDNLPLVCPKPTPEP